MKKILSAIAAVTLFVACNNGANTNDQDTSALTTVDTSVAGMTSSMDGTPIYTEGDIIKREGKPYMYSAGNWVLVEKEHKLDNGVVVRTNGELVNKDGKVVEWEEGQYTTKTGQFFDKTGAAIDNAWDKTKEGVKNATDATKKGLQEAGDSISSGTKRLGDKVKDAL